MIVNLSETYYDDNNSDDETTNKLCHVCDFLKSVYFNNRLLTFPN